MEMIRLLLLFSLTFCAGYPAIDKTKPEESRRTMRKIFVDAIPYFRNCYMNYSSDVTPTIGISFNTRMLVKQSGEVLNVEITKAKKLPLQFKRCFVAVMESLPFPKVLDPGGIIIKQPFNFYPSRNDRKYPKIDFEPSS